MPFPAPELFTVSVCFASGSLPRQCLSTGLACIVNAGQQTCTDDVSSMEFHPGDLFTVEIVTHTINGVGGTGGPPAYAFALNDIPVPTATPTLTPTATPTDRPTNTPTNIPTNTRTSADAYV